MSDILQERCRLSARQRVILLLDEGSFEEISAGDAAGVVTGKGKIVGRPVCVYAHESSVAGGSMTWDMAERIGELMDMALENGIPLVGLNDSAGARIQDGVSSLAGYGEIFQRNIKASGVIPQISGVLGPCAGGAVYSPALTDFTVMVRKSSCMFVTGPSVVKTVTGESVSREDLGGTAVHATRSGVAHHSADTEEDAIAWIRNLVQFLPCNNREMPPCCPCMDPIDRMDEALAGMVPANPAKAYDMLKVVQTVVDDGEVFEIHQAWAPNIITAFVRMGGQTVGVVANQPRVMAGVLDINASRKAARFVRFCDAFNIPLVTLVDVPGFLCGTQQEAGGIILHGAKLLYAYGEATVPKITVTLRKSYGGAHITMSCKQLGGDVNFVWPTANLGVMGVDGAVEVLYSKELAAVDDPDCRKQMLLRFRQEYQDKFCNIDAAVAAGYVDEVIKPEETRYKVISALRNFSDIKRCMAWKKHDNLPL